MGKVFYHVEYAEELIEAVNRRLDQLGKKVAKGRWASLDG